MSRSMFSSLVANRPLITQLLVRDVQSRYRGSLLGVGWALLQPIVLLGAYWLVLSKIFAIRWAGEAVGQPAYVLPLSIFIGVVLHGFLVDCLVRAPTLITANPSYVKKVVFPLEALIWSSFISSLLHSLVSLAMVFVALALATGGIPLTLVFFPLVLLPLVGITLGLVWFVAATGVYFRDLSQVMGPLSMLLLLLAPVLYPMSAVPPSFHALIAWNPLTLPIEQMRLILLDGQLPHFGQLALYSVGAALFAWLGFAWFAKLREGFADVV